MGLTSPLGRSWYATLVSKWIWPTVFRCCLALRRSVSSHTASCHLFDLARSSSRRTNCARPKATPVSGARPPGWRPSQWVVSRSARVMTRGRSRVRANPMPQPVRHPTPAIVRPDSYTAIGCTICYGRLARDTPGRGRHRGSPYLDVGATL